MEDTTSLPDELDNNSFIVGNFQNFILKYLINPLIMDVLKK